jgi:hypothetical protein
MRAAIALTLALALGSCGGEDVFSPTTETVAGSFGSRASGDIASRGARSAVRTR